LKKIIVAKAFLINPKGLILVLRRAENDKIRPLTWDLPGGGVEDGEDPNDAVIRETKEEAGINLKDPQVFIVKNTSAKDHVIRILYYAKITDSKIIVSLEHNSFKWVTRSEFGNLDIPNHYKECISKLPK